MKLGGSGAAVSQFLSKIWALVEDPQTNEFICWSADRQSFKKILPKHFKHNNMASFVKQLNSYGFHKVMQYKSGSAKQERYGSGKYQHPFFRKGQEGLLSKIKRKVPLPHIENGKIDPEEIHKMLAIIHQVQGEQDVIDSTLKSLKWENKALWKEVLVLKQKQIQHQQVCEASVASQCYNQTMGLPQKQPLTIDSTGDYNQQSAQELVDQSQTVENQCDRTGSRNKSEVRVNDLEGDQLRVQADTSQMWTRMAEDCSKNFCITGTSLDSIKKDAGRTDAASNFIWISEADIKSEPFDTSVSVVSRLGSSLAECSGKIHPSNTDWVLEHCNRSCENQEYLEPEQATDNSRLGTEAEDYSSTCSDSGHVEKRRKINHFAIQKTEQHMNQMHNDSIKLTERVLALEEKCLRKLSEISSTLSSLDSFIINTEKSQRQSQAQGGLIES
ncbi:heat shock factor protein 2-like [Apteryx mantelli]|uniref:Heat shock factor protein 2-like n=1 Tax=Apteryx mantelli TaxID=2696672 RepID=A0A8B7J3F1_9AVES|nr:PREDICTED: heat shock factor protein 2-like [Apteryx mantelli mantelli]